ncbi:MAG: hypothetical protein C0483_20080 [Pirellula sp.]|nr:hypothetical protein [Pirellula sp.]
MSNDRSTQQALRPLPPPLANLPQPLAYPAYTYPINRAPPIAPPVAYPPILYPPTPVASVVAYPAVPVPPPLPTSPPVLETPARVQARRLAERQRIEKLRKTFARPSRRPQLVLAVPEWAWLLRRSAISGATSAFVHMLLLLLLALMTFRMEKTKQKPVVLEATIDSLDTKHPHGQPIVTAAATAISNGVAVLPMARLHDINKALNTPNSSGAGVLEALQIPAPNIPGRNTATGSGHGSSRLGAAGGAGQGAQFFGVPARGRKFIFVVDTSGSMFGNGRYLRCRMELIESLRSLQRDQRFFIIYFNNKTHAMPGKQLVEAKPDAINRLIPWIEGVQPVGTTEPWPALSLALRMNPDAVYFLTDGAFDDDVINKVRTYSRSKKIPIHTIAIEGDEGEKQLEALARMTGGTYRFIKPIDGIEPLPEVPPQISPDAAMPLPPLPAATSMPASPAPATPPAL